MRYPVDVAGGPIIDTQEFLALSSFFNYQLSGEPVNWHGILGLMVPQPLAPADERAVLRALEFLGRAYGEQKRRLGPFAVLHPIRVAALLLKAWPGTPVDVLLATLLHDKEEDVVPAGYEPAAWQEVERAFAGVLDAVGSARAERLLSRLGWLTKSPGQRYHAYLGHLLDGCRSDPALATIKLADRLDNTFDLRVDLQDFTENSRCYQIVFDIFFLKDYKGFKSERPHPIARKINGAMRLYQLYKNAVFLSLLRWAGVSLDDAGRRLASTLAVASIRESQTILLHIFGYHLQDPRDQRRILLDVMEYSHRGGFNRISEAGDHPLDGLFRRCFVFADKQSKKEGLAALYQDKPLMGRAALSFIVIFANFLNDPGYWIQGITPAGIEPVG